MKKHAWLSINLLMIIIASVFLYSSNPTKTSSADISRIKSYAQFASIVSSVSKNMATYPYKNFGWDMMRNEVAEGAPDHSNTNVQFEGIDEADSLKTNGNFVYYISNNSLFIYQSYPIDESKLVSKISFEDDSYYSSMFLHDQYLIIMGTYHDRQLTANAGDSLPNRIAYWGTPYVKTIIYDISNPEKPNKLYSLEVEGYFLTARLIEDEVVILSQKGNYFWRYGIAEDTQDPKEVLTKIKENGVLKPMDVTDVFIVGEPETLDMVNLSKIKIQANPSSSTSSIMGHFSTVMLNKDYMYLAKANYGYNADPAATQITSSDILKVDYQRDFNVLATATVTGTLINQFAMDEYDGYLRVATTTHIYSPLSPTPKTTNQLIVLDRQLKQAGVIENIANNEQIYSVRFTKDRGYLVTFEQVDPFFVLDLSNPRSPKILGELKIPGFSTYLHKVSDTTVMGLGQNVKVDQDRLTIDGLKISLFDVSNELSPKEIDSYGFKHPYSYTEALHNHTALLTYPKTNLFGFIYMDYDIVVSNEYGLYQAHVFLFDTGNNKINVRLNASSKELGFESNAMERLVIIDNHLYIFGFDQCTIVDIQTGQIRSKILANE